MIILYYKYAAIVSMPEKLVRDKIPEIIKKVGKKANTRTAQDLEVKQLLLEKIVEEAKELRESGDHEEIADMMEVIDALLKFENISKEDIEKIRIKKAKEKGSFDKRTILID